MNNSRFTSAIVTVATFAILIILPAAPAPTIPQTAKTAVSEMQLSLDPAQSKLSWTLDSTLHLVHGTFNIKNGNLHFDPDTGKASGEIVVLVTSGDTGNSSRDEKMHKEVLQSSQYPDAIFKPSQVEGRVSRTGASDVKLHGTLLLHGSDHDLVVPVHTELANDKWKGTAKFEVPFIQWGLKDPSNFLLKVKPIVNVEVEMSGSVTQSK
jgi:polyisoprenoid-binding protein YceI